MDHPPERRLPPLTVSQLTASVQETVSALFAEVCVVGEISELSRPRSGHVYFTLQDDAAQLRVVLWRLSAAQVDFPLDEGQQVVCRGALDVYPARGSYQLICRSIAPVGEGARQAALRKLQQKLAAEGLFSLERKRPLPPFPRRIGFVTSPSGAAIRDFLQVLARRGRGLEVLVIPARVQGAGATAEIVAGIQQANRLEPPLDVLVVGRGGGSIEDLWSFNEEPVVRAIAASRVPVVSAVGHEIDVTLADLAADVRALTPTEAAERVAPDAADLSRQIAGLQQRLRSALAGKAAAARAKLAGLLSRRVLRRPLDRFLELRQRLDEVDRDFTSAAQDYLSRRREQLAQRVAQIDALSPLSILSRGYSIAQRAQDGATLRSTADISAGEQIITRLPDGKILSRVLEVSPHASRE